MTRFDPYSFWEDDYIPLEEEFLRYLKYVPLNSDHNNVWSLKLANQLLIIGNSIESFFKSILPFYLNYKIEEHTKICPPSFGYHNTALDHILQLKNRLNNNETNFGMFKEIFEEFYQLSNRTVYVLRNKDSVDPFEEWKTNTKTIPWWKVYRDLKHDKYANKELATLKIVLNALSALFLLNVHHIESRSFLVMNGTIKTRYGHEIINLQQYIDELQKIHMRHLPSIPIARTKLFAYIYDDEIVHNGRYYWNCGVDDPWRIIDPGNIY